MGLLSSAQPVYRDITDATALDPHALAPLACDVSVVSDESTAAEALVARHVERLKNPTFTALWWDIFERLRADAVIAHRARVVWHVQAALQDKSIQVGANWFDAIARFFAHINQIMFQHQASDWVAESQCKLHLYGRGWDAHLSLARFARGAIDSDSMRLAIYRASRINLAADVYGAVTPRVIEGIGVGGFFLLRFTPADVLERFFPPISAFCGANQVASYAQLAERATPTIRALLDVAGRTIGAHPLQAWPEFVAELRSAADAGYTRSAAAIWPQYPAVAFSSRDELVGLVERYLYDAP